MKAWQRARDLFRNATPVIIPDQDQTWESDASEMGSRIDFDRRLFWKNVVPGSGAPDCLAVAALQAMENKGFVLPAYDSILDDGIAAADAGDMPSLHMANMRLWSVIRAARADLEHPSQRTVRYGSWEEFDAAVAWLPDTPVDVQSEAFAGRIRAGWWAQIAGAAAGTAIEGYTAEKLAERFGAMTSYVRPPNTYNDDITYEIAFLKAFMEKGNAVSSADIGALWVGLIPFAWSAEAIALDHLHKGILPPDSGRLANPFDEWIGAQMRGAICGMVAPGKPREAARLAWLDGQISHTSNGILGEVFNAVLCAHAFGEPDLRRLTQDVIALFSSETEYGAVLHDALAACLKSGTWQDAWKICDRKLVEYHWIHVYPNAAAEVVALWFGNGDFDRTLEIICGIGHDVDCNAAQILCALAIARGRDAIDRRWIDPLGDEVVTYMRDPMKTSVDELTEETVAAARKWMK